MKPSTVSWASKRTSPPRTTATALVKCAPRFSRRQAAQLLQEQAVAVVVGRAFAAEAAGVEAGPAVERIHAEAGVVGDGQEARAARVVAGLEHRVLVERLPRLFRRFRDAEVARSHDVERKAGHELPHLRQLARVLAGEEEVGHAPMISAAGRPRTP
jgi:hypothetical protein